MSDERLTDYWQTLWGEGENLSPLPLTVRALVMFFLILFMTRLGGVRIFGNKSSFDNVVVIMLGAIAARGIVGATPFASAVAGSALLIGVHYVVAWLGVRYERLGRLISGQPVLLYRRPKVLPKNLLRAVVSQGDLEQSARLETGSSSLEGVEEAFMEKNGRISFVRKPAWTACSPEPARPVADTSRHLAK